MCKSAVLFFTLFFFASVGLTQQKKVKIKSDEKVQFIYEKDSSCLDRKETIFLIKEFFAFHDLLKKKDYQAYLNHLSEGTLRRIQPERLQKKFKKLTAYQVDLFGKIKVNAIRIYTPNSDNLESSDIYQCTVQLPEGQKITKRTGFDPLSKSKMENADLHVALLFVKADQGYRVVINH